MVENVYDPLVEYRDVFAGRFKDVAKETFEQLAAEAEVDIEANRETCRKLYEKRSSLTSLKADIAWLIFACVLLWILVAAGVVAVCVVLGDLTADLIVNIGIAIVFIALIPSLVLHPAIKELKSERACLEAQIDSLQAEAWEQMEPLNRLYDWDILTRMMTRTVPRLEFDPFFTNQRLADLQHVYGWSGSFNSGRSVLYSHSGLINGNPFVICRTKKQEWGEKTYYGHKTIHWTTREKGSDGKYHTVHHSETLTASYTAPFPEYYEKTRLIYGNTAAPDLIFNRVKSGLAGHEGSWAYRRKRRSLRKKSDDLTHSDYAMMTNEEFEVCFDTSDRNSNHQLALLFTPLAQQSMLSLLKDHSTGYGDDFDFLKDRMINTIVPDHIQSLDLDMNPDQYRHFDYDKAEQIFYTLNAVYFRAIYFCLAPLLCVPMYQQIRPHHEIYGRDMRKRSSFWEHEALANFWGVNHFKSALCDTDCILKTQEERKPDGSSLIRVIAYGFHAYRRVKHFSVYGGDGRYHDVPVYWDEYLSADGRGYIHMCEDEPQSDESLTQTQRLRHISGILSSTGLDVYRRHIASKVGNI